MTASSTDIQGTLVQLEALHQAYSTILEDAKQQLGSLELDAKAIKDIADLVKNDSGLLRDLQESVISDFAQSLREGSDTALQHWRGRQFMEMVTKGVLETIKEEIQSYVTNLLNDANINESIDRRVELQLISRSDVQEAMTTQRLFAAAVKGVIEDK